MKPTAEHGRILQQFRNILSEACPEYRSVPPLHTPDERLSIARLFRFGETVESASIERFFPPDVIATLEQLGLVQRCGNSLTTGEFRLVRHLSLLLFCHRISTHAKFYYGTDSLALSRVLLPASGRVLDLCAGVGAQSLVSAQSAASVTAVEIEPSAEPVFYVNAAMNGLTDKVEFLSGDLFEPVAGRQFDHICSNPPFLPVPSEVRFPRFAGGGADGLDIVRRLLHGLPQFLAPGGACQIIGSVLGSYQGPNLSSMEDLAVASNLAIEVSCYTYEELDERTLALFAATAVDCAGGDAREAYRAHFIRLGATHVYYFVMRARHRRGRTSSQLKDRGGNSRSRPRVSAKTKSSDR